MQPDRETLELSRRLVYLAAERTLSSWIRTALSLMALGFVIDRFDLILRQLTGISAQLLLRSRAIWAWSGSILVGMGVLMAVAAGVRYLRFAIGYHRGRHTDVRNGLALGALFALLLGVFGVALIGVLAMVMR